MQFLSDNAAAVHPKVWAAMKAADAAQSAYDGDALSASLDARFSDLFGRDAHVLWVSSGTAANCLALATLCPPHGAVVCHRDAHIETDEGGAPGFFLHGAKLLLAEGPGALLTPASLTAAADRVCRGIHAVSAHAISVTQATEYGRVYRPGELAELGALARERGLGFHVDGARFANAVAFLGTSPAEAMGPCDVLSFGCVKNGAMNADAIVFFDPEHAALARRRRKRGGLLQSKGRFAAAQIHALLDGDLWLVNARAANLTASEIAQSCRDRLAYPVEANELFIRLSPGERESLRGQGFAFQDWGPELARFVTAWDTRADHASALAHALAGL